MPTMFTAHSLQCVVVQKVKMIERNRRKIQLSVASFMINLIPYNSRSMDIIFLLLCLLLLLSDSIVILLLYIRYDSCYGTKWKIPYRWIRCQLYSTCIQLKIFAIGQQDVFRGFLRQKHGLKHLFRETPKYMKSYTVFS